MKINFDITHTNYLIRIFFINKKYLLLKNYFLNKFKNIFLKKN